MGQCLIGAIAPPPTATARHGISPARSPRVVRGIRRVFCYLQAVAAVRLAGDRVSGGPSMVCIGCSAAGIAAVAPVAVAHHRREMSHRVVRGNQRHHARKHRCLGLGLGLGLGLRALLVRARCRAAHPPHHQRPPQQPPAVVRCVDGPRVGHWCGPMPTIRARPHAPVQNRAVRLWRHAIQRFPSAGPVRLARQRVQQLQRLFVRIKLRVGYGMGLLGMWCLTTVLLVAPVVPLVKSAMHCWLLLVVFTPQLFQEHSPVRHKLSIVVVPSPQQPVQLHLRPPAQRQQPEPLVPQPAQAQRQQPEPQLPRVPQPAQAQRQRGSIPAAATKCGRGIPECRHGC